MIATGRWSSSWPKCRMMGFRPSGPPVAKHLIREPTPPLLGAAFGPVVLAARSSTSRPPPRSLLAPPPADPHHAAPDPRARSQMRPLRQPQEDQPTWSAPKS